MQKINYIIGKLRDTSKEISDSIDKVEKEVFTNEILTDYWAALLDNLVRIGAVK